VYTKTFVGAVNVIYFILAIINYYYYYYRCVPTSKTRLRTMCIVRIAFDNRDTGLTERRTTAAKAATMTTVKDEKETDSKYNTVAVVVGGCGPAVVRARVDFHHRILASVDSGVAL
jgi:hypothetical protein